MSKIAVVGDRESIYGFASLGLEPYYIEDYEEDEFVPMFKKLCQSKNYSIIYVTESCAVILEKEIEKYSDSKIPAIILIPGVSGNTGNGIAAVKKSVERAVGSDIIFND